MPTNTYVHLSVLRNAGLVTATKSGRTIAYTPVRGALDELVASLPKRMEVLLQANSEISFARPLRILMALYRSHLSHVPNAINEQRVAPLPVNWAGIFPCRTCSPIVYFAELGTSCTIHAVIGGNAFGPAKGYHVVNENGKPIC